MESAPKAAYIHPTAVVEQGVHLGQGSSVWHFCHLRAGSWIGQDVSLGQGVHVAPGVRVSDGCRVQNHVSLYEGVVLERDVFVGPSAVFTNVLTPRAHVSRRQEFLATWVGQGASVGANATIVCGVRIGAYAMVGAGAVVTRDVPAYALVVGNPARQVGWVCACGERLREALECPRCHARYTLTEDQHLEPE